jgi:hypothetical protein
MKKMLVIAFTAGALLGASTMLIAVHVVINQGREQIRQETYETLHRLPMTGYDEPARWGK